MTIIRVIFTKFAKIELDDAIVFYELEYAGLGKRFKADATLIISGFNSKNALIPKG